MSETDGELLQRMGTDAAVWAEVFAEKFNRAADELTGDAMCLELVERLLDPAPGDLLHVWLCNAIEAGRSAGYSAAKREHDPAWPLSVTA